MGVRVEDDICEAILDHLKSIIILVLLAGVVAYFYQPEDPGADTEKITSAVKRVVDGDSLYLHGYEPQIRLWGVDAPERDEKGFKAATRQLSRMALNQVLACQRVDTDRYGRTVARCFLKDGREINRMMIESGTATEYMRYSKGFYKKEQAQPLLGK